MSISIAFLTGCEELVSKGKNKEVISKLLEVKEETAYRTHILSLSNRLRKLSNSQLTGILSTEQQSLQSNKLSNDLLRLIEALRGELAGEKTGLTFDEPTSVSSTGNMFYSKYLPMILSALAVWGICFFAYRPLLTTCESDVNLSGAWGIYSQLADENKGSVKIVQEKCQTSFQLSGLIKILNETEEREVDFSSKIGGLNDGEILFVYENFEGEMGICRGIAPEDSKNGFSVQCIDLIGYNKDLKEKVNLVFKRVEEAE